LLFQHQPKNPEKSNMPQKQRMESKHDMFRYGLIHFDVLIHISFTFALTLGGGVGSQTLKTITWISNTKLPTYCNSCHNCNYCNNTLSKKTILGLQNLVSCWVGSCAPRIPLNLTDIPATRINTCQNGYSKGYINRLTSIN
jgi:hypothetical protein